MVFYKKGDILLAEVINSDQTTVKQRPVLVVQSNRIITELNQLLVAVITSNLNRLGRNTRIPISVGELAETGLLTESIIVMDNIVTLKSKFIIRKIGFYKDMERINSVLRNVFDL